MNSLFSLLLRKFTQTRKQASEREIEKFLTGKSYPLVVFKLVEKDFHSLFNIIVLSTVLHMPRFKLEKPLMKNQTKFFLSGLMQVDNHTCFERKLKKNAENKTIKNSTSIGT